MPPKIERDILIPSVFELAVIAQMISLIPSENSRPSDYLANLALETWDACARIRNARIATIKAAIELNSPQNKKLLKRKEIGFPIELKEFLLLMMPKRKGAERMAIYRQFISDQIRYFDYVRAYAPNGQSYDSVPEPTESQINERIGIQLVHGLAVLEYARTSAAFQHWFADYEAAKRQERASKGGQQFAAKKGKKNFKIIIDGGSTNTQPPSHIFGGQA